MNKVEIYTNRILKIIYIPLIVCILIISSCTEGTMNPYDNNIIIPDPPKDTVILSSEDFNNNIGSKWIYEVISYSDSSYKIIDTLVITVKDTFRINNRIYTYWNYFYSNSNSYTSGKFVSLNKDTVSSLINITAEKSVIEYAFPLKEGKKWAFFDTTDSAYVVQKNNLSVIAGTFSDVYNIRFHSKNYINNINTFGFLVPIDEFYKPGIGTLKSTNWDILSNYIVIFELIGYELK